MKECYLCKERDAFLVLIGFNWYCAKHTQEGMQAFQSQFNHNGNKESPEIQEKNIVQSDV